MEPVAGFSALKPLPGEDGVFTAWSETLRREVRLELVPASAWRDPKVRRGLERLMAAASQLDHHALVRPLLLTSTPDRGACVAFELVDGPDLARALEGRGPLEAVDALTLLEPLVAALAVAHHAGIVHGDVRPANVVLPGGLQAYRARLGGFGRAYLGVRPEALPWLAPERLAGGEPTVASDVYGLGALLYAALTGQPPWRGSDAAAVLAQQRSGPPPPLPASAAHLAEAVMACLKFDAASRLPSVQELLHLVTRSNRTLVSSDNLPRVTATGLGVSPTRLGTYDIVGLLGEGTMGQVYLAKHSRLGRQVAIKLLRPDQYHRTDLVHRFFQEAQAVNQISHEHIVEVIDFVEEPGASGPAWVYTVMEHLEGHTLGHALEAGPMELSRGVGIVRQVCEALQAAHQVGVVHRDLKPDNIFLTRRGGRQDYVKVLDFGVAKLMAPVLDSPKVATVDGAIIGTPVFMAPEQALGGSVDPRADIYAAGVILYRMLAGQLPFDGATFGSILSKVIRDPPPPLPKVTPHGQPVPAGLARIVMQCLEKDPAKRPPSMSALFEALAPYVVPGAQVTTAGSPRWRLYAGLLLLVLLGAVALRARANRLEARRASHTTGAPDADPGELVRLGPSEPAGGPAVAGDGGGGTDAGHDAGAAGPDDAGAAAADAGATAGDAGASRPRNPRPADLSELREDEVKRVVLAAPGIHQCVGLHQLNLGDGIVLKATITPDGTVSDVVAPTAAPSQEGAVNCLSGAVRKIRFRAHRGPVLVFDLPFNLTKR